MIERLGYDDGGSDSRCASEKQQRSKSPGRKFCLDSHRYRLAVHRNRDLDAERWMREERGFYCPYICRTTARGLGLGLSFLQRLPGQPPTRLG